MRLRGPAIYISHLSLINFRNYAHLELDLPPGVVLLHGANGQGKSNLLEAIYMLALAKSPRASAERDVVRAEALTPDAQACVSANVETSDQPLRLQIGFRVRLRDQAGPHPAREGEDGTSTGPWADRAVVDKEVRINGLPRRASSLVGRLNAVMFSAQDLQLIFGPPPLRRRSLDMLISQTDAAYLRSLQRYQRVVFQRNHLLRQVGEGRAPPGDLEFWDGEMAAEGARIIAKRKETVARLSELAGPFHRELAGGAETLRLAYRPSVDPGDGLSEREATAALLRAIEEARDREARHGATLQGPHRDDVQVLLNGMDAAAYASRGQARTAMLAVRLAEARHLADRRRERPVLLLDDVLSELDGARRAHVLEAAQGYEQCFITTADTAAIEGRFLRDMARLAVSAGRLEPAGTHHAVAGAANGPDPNGGYVGDLSQAGAEPQEALSP